MSDPTTRLGGDKFDSDVDARRLVTYAIGLAVVVLLVSVVVFGVHALFKSESLGQNPPPSPIPEANRIQQPPGPRLQTSPERDLATLLAKQNGRLATFGWVDQSAGIVHIPIDDAIDLVASGTVPLPGGQEGTGAPPAVPASAGGPQ